MTNTLARLLIRASGFFRHYGLVIRHSVERHGLVIHLWTQIARAFSGLLPDGTWASLEQAWAPESQARQTIKTSSAGVTPDPA
jgi:hypothetical protein